MRLTNQTQRIAALRKIPLLASMTRTVLGELAHRVEEIEVPAGAYLTRQGGVGTEAYVVLDGSFSVRRHTRTVGTRKKGDVFGEMSLIDAMPRTANVVAEKDSSVLVVHKRDFDKLMETPRVRTRALRNLAGRLRDVDDRVMG
ncbi:MAG: cyclic nucleotide-binding domain-containing protein [Acidimicrobiia bacterium]|nr:cyclic nucleotide-binding domain-containing protein [Acidimicrobiia bacterium]MBT8216281.1 cyclic nucleotide-binding domain-containing protein [Acidimicrobiia bacterium]NNF10354.1 cyclic nucleotide-binding domain-containing protein [Acidimicrobiia bacterium]NNL71532.1 cyclic nucleotide-binding domain-containing protein [Acidimicrobiia bacterium]